MNHDPYLPPRAALIAAPVRDDDDGCWRSGQDLFVRAGAVLPPRCITCNEPALMPARKRTVYWHSSWLYLLIFIGVPVYVIVALIVRKTRKLHPGFCQAHTRRRRRLTLLAWGLFVGGFALLFVVQTPAMLAGVLALIGAIGLFTKLGNPLRALHIDTRRAQLRGCGEAFLASLPGRR